MWSATSIHIPPGTFASQILVLEFTWIYRSLLNRILLIIACFTPITTLPLSYHGHMHLPATTLKRCASIARNGDRVVSSSANCSMQTRFGSSSQTRLQKGCRNVCFSMEHDTLSGRFAGFFAYTKSTAATNRKIAVQITLLIGQFPRFFIISAYRYPPGLFPLCFFVEVADGAASLQRTRGRERDLLAPRAT